MSETKDKSQEAPEVKATETKEAKKESKYAEKAAGLFKDYPKITELHFTADGTAFFSKSDAGNHAKTLKDKTVTLVKK